MLAAAEGYRTEMQTLAGMRELDVWYRRLDAKACSRIWAPRPPPG